MREREGAKAREREDVCACVCVGRSVFMRIKIRRKQKSGCNTHTTDTSESTETDNLCNGRPYSGGYGSSGGKCVIKTHAQPQVQSVLPCILQLNQSQHISIFICMWRQIATATVTERAKWKLMENKSEARLVIRAKFEMMCDRVHSFDSVSVWFDQVCVRCACMM